MTVSPDVLKLAARRIAKARALLLLEPKFAFWAAAGLHLRPQPWPDMMSQGALGPIGTDGTYLLYDPEFIAGPTWSDDELVGVMAHEVSHAVKGDCWRRGSRDPVGWNIAADRRINPELTRAGLTLPPGPLNDPTDFGRSAEEIYNTLPQAPPSSGGNANGSQGQMPGDVLDPNKPGAGAAERQAQAEELDRKWNLIARQAAQIAAAQGHLPAGMEHLLEPIRPKLDPWAMLHHFVSMCRHDDYSWSRPSRRSLYAGLYLPSLRSEGIGELVIAVDTSGSMSNAVLSRCLGFLNSVLIEVKPERVHFIEVDAALQHATVFEAGEELPTAVAVHGRGGTNMRPVWEWIDDQHISPVCAIVLSDMCMGQHDFGDAQPFPVLWVSTTAGARAPHGETVEMLA